MIGFGYVLFFVCLITSAVHSLANSQDAIEDKNTDQIETTLKTGHDNRSGTGRKRIVAVAKADAVPTRIWWQHNLTERAAVFSVTINNPPMWFITKYIPYFIITVEDIDGTIAVCNKFTNQSVVKQPSGPGIQLFHPCTQSEVGKTISIRQDSIRVLEDNIPLFDFQVSKLSFVDNRALLKSTKQIGTYQGLTKYDSKYAVDDTNTTCAVADSGSPASYAWWQVDLLDRYNITSVRLTATSSENAYAYLDNFVITVDDDNAVNSNRVCATQNRGTPPSPGVQLVIQCTPPIVGQFVTIRRLGGVQPWMLALCDAQVIGDYIPQRLTTTTTTTPPPPPAPQATDPPLPPVAPVNPGVPAVNPPSRPSMKNGSSTPDRMSCISLATFVMVVGKLLDFPKTS
jgi:hypothetical protein